MPFVRRSADGQLASLHRLPDEPGQEFLSDEEDEVQAFIGRPADAEEGFARLDADFIRVLEDLIDVLVRAKVINITDLPAEARQKLYSRKGHRHSSTLSELNLLGDQAGSEAALVADFAPFADR